MVSTYEKLNHCAKFIQSLRHQGKRYIFVPFSPNLVFPKQSLRKFEIGYLEERPKEISTCLKVLQYLYFKGLFRTKIDTTSVSLK